MDPPGRWRALTDKEWNSLLVDFPNLQRASCRWLGPDTTAFNCIAWSINVTNDQFDPGATINEFIQFYAAHGFVQCQKAQAEVDGWATGTAPNLEPQHASRIWGGTPGWTSKLGDDCLVQHGRNDLHGDFYGERVVFFRRAPRPSKTSDTVVETPAEHDKAAQHVTSVAARLREAFPQYARKFDAAWESWRGSWARTRSSRSDAFAKGKPWEELVAMGPAVLTLVTVELKDERNCIGGRLYEALQPESYEKFRHRHDLKFTSLQHQAKMMIVLHARLLSQFDRLAEEWAEQKERNKRSSRSAAHTHECSAFGALAELGHPITSMIMDRYAREQTGWWHELLHVIVHGRPSGARTINKEEQYAAWKKWFEIGEQVDFAA